MVKSTIYDVWFSFEKECKRCGQAFTDKDGGCLKYTMVHISALGMPVCGCGKKLTIKTEVEINN